MKIFSEQKNRYILATIQLANRIYMGETIPVRDFERELLKEACDDDSGIGLEYISRLRKNYNIFDFSDKNRIRLFIEAPIPVMTSIAEKIWLKDILEDSRIRLFLDDSLVKKLGEKLADIPDIKLREHIDKNSVSHTADTIDGGFAERFRIIINGISKGHYLIYSNVSRDGTVYTDEKAVPFKIEYSIIQQKFRLSMWSAREQRPVKANISSMFNLRMGEPIEECQYKSIKELVSRKKAAAPIVLKVFNRNNSIERASLLFSQYDRLSHWENDDTLVMEINYHSFDEDEIFFNILSFGPSVKVVSPPHIVGRIKAILF